MVVAQDASCSVDVQGCSNDFPWVNARAVDGAGEECFATQDSVSVVQPDDCEFFGEFGTQLHAQEVDGVPWIADAALAVKLASEDAFGGLENVLLGRFAGELVAAFAVAVDTHVLSPQRPIAPWVRRKWNGKRQAAPIGHCNAMQWTTGGNRVDEVYPCAWRP
jgi:hypothetical protein